MEKGKCPHLKGKVEARMEIHIDDQGNVLCPLCGRILYARYARMTRQIPLTWNPFWTADGFHYEVERGYIEQPKFDMIYCPEYDCDFESRHPDILGKCLRKTLKMEADAKEIILDLLACVPATNLGPYLTAHARATMWLRGREKR